MYNVIPIRSYAHSSRPVIVQTPAYVIVMCEAGHVWALIERSGWPDLAQRFTGANKQIGCTGSRGDLAVAFREDLREAA